MKPLILWARDQRPEPYTLRIFERRPERVRGELDIAGEWLPFVYDRQELVITIGEGEGTRTVHIDEWGWER